MCQFRIPLVFSFMFFSLAAIAQSSSQNLESAFTHQKLSRDYVAVKQWEKARDEAKLATAADSVSPLNRDAWLLLAGTEERLGNLSEARDAYIKYLSLSPSPEKREAVMQRYNEIAPRAELYERYKWGSNSSGLVFGFSPQFQSQVQEQLGSDLKTAIDVGLRFGTFSFGYKRGRDSVGVFKVPTSTSANPSYVAVPAGGVHLMEAIYFQNNFELGSDTDTKSRVWSIPLYFAGVVNAVRTPSDALYNNIAYDMGTGLRVDIYTKSTFSFDMSALYHLGIPFWDVRSQDGESQGIKNKNNEIVSGSNTGAEIRVGIKFLFGSTPPTVD